MAAQGAAGGFVVSSGTYTAEAKAFAEGRNIQLVDGALLKGWIANRPDSAHPYMSSGEVVKAASQSSTPLCPVCNSSMILRAAKRGSNTGGEFWGCSKFPACRGIRNAPA
ncbi:hypothetical protein D9M71_804280 [compost metagenome]